MLEYAFDEMATRVLIGILLLHCVTGIASLLDFTCVSTNPRISINGDNDMSIGGYKSGDDTDASVTFGRASDTATGSGLPSCLSQSNNTGTNVRLLYMPESCSKQRIGAFYCEARKDGVMERIITTVMASDSKIIPEQVSQTVSIGESVHFVMRLSTSAHRWRHNGGDFITDWNGKTNATIDNVSVDDAGVYEFHENGQRPQGKHAIFQLVVRACMSNKWGPPACTEDCPICLNDGICDERSGECVCAPGFTGVNCQTVLGSNRYGQDGRLACNISNDAHSDACAGRLFCLPHPYGCSCAAGYKGIDCDEECPDGYYGAGCKSKCHCAPGVSCLTDTGECDGGRCLKGWSGVNCQQRCEKPGPVTDLFVTPTKSPYELFVSWQPSVENNCRETLYVVKITLLNKDQCQTQNNSHTLEIPYENSTALTKLLEDLLPFSTYSVSVKEKNTLGQGAAVNIVQRTNATKPSSAPSDVVVTAVASDTITFKWTDPPCGKRHGNITSYSYVLSNKLSGKEILCNATPSTSVKIGGLDPSTVYYFTVTAVNDVGEGPPYSLTTETMNSSLTTGPTKSPGHKVFSLSWINGLLVCIIAGLVLIVVIVACKLRNVYKRLDKTGKRELLSSPTDNTHRNASPPNKAIQLSVGGYVEYKPENNENTYQAIRTEGDHQQETTQARKESVTLYDEIPLTGETNDKGMTEGNSYYNTPGKADIHTSTKGESDSMYENFKA